MLKRSLLCILMCLLISCAGYQKSTIKPEDFDNHIVVAEHNILYRVITVDNKWIDVKKFATRSDTLRIYEERMQHSHQIHQYDEPKNIPVD